ncbi:triphosphoribosyl-dephospho-CoA synthase [Pediococcus damnosus]|uniref:triphosphoribosyl-dephospho-CoA synthase n=1 Tax=Pediococcus damnosus TaxID=51663 RepID=UPI001863E79B|nr:triphosphoribosyl-dephospho-CoA synthase [Pediococcus damnosus]
MIKVSNAEKLAEQAVAALKWEANFSPKPGLVTKSSNGSHKDMNIDLFIKSADSLYDTFLRIANVSKSIPISVVLREKVGAIGRDGEKAMLTATHGVNTHKGAIWALGIIVAVISNQSTTDMSIIFQKCGELASIADRYVQLHSKTTYGIQVKKVYKINGAREEAANGFPHVKTSLRLINVKTSLRLINGQMVTDQLAWLRVLCLLYATVDDTNVIHRSSLSVLRVFQNEAKQAFEAPVIQESLAFKQVTKMAEDYQISPGGCADLFAATYFLNNLVIEED